MDLAGGTPLNIRRLIVPLTVAAIAACAAGANAQGAFPAPLPGQPAPANASPFPPVNGAAPAVSFGQPSAFPSSGAAPLAGAGVSAAPMGAPPRAAGSSSDACMKGFVPLREETEKRGKLIKAAIARRAQPEEACKLVENYSQAELKMMEYVKLNTTKCGIPPQISEQMKKGHAGTQATLKKVCGAAQAQKNAPAAGPSLSEVLGSSAALPEVSATKKGGSTFDTLNGNVLAR
ncbi:MAG: hypothetical protein QOD89_2777 [Bradyrhizobium sp.]|jgi:hypothetical protein|nr:hypothetical protein [Bradyrhizobium sp.]